MVIYLHQQEINIYNKADILAASLLIPYRGNFLNRKGLSDASGVSLTKTEYGSKVHSLWILMKSLRIISDE